MAGNESMLGTMNKAYFVQALLHLCWKKVVMKRRQQYFYHLILLHPCNRSGLSLYNHMSKNSNH
jgi:hypothetical protein